MVSLLTLHPPQNDDFRFARALNILHFFGYGECVLNKEIQRQGK